MLATAFAARTGTILFIRIITVVAASAGLRNVVDLGLLEVSGGLAWSRGWSRGWSAEKIGIVTIVHARSVEVLFVKVSWYMPQKIGNLTLAFSKEFIPGKLLAILYED